MEKQENISMEIRKYRVIVKLISAIIDGILLRGADRVTYRLGNTISFGAAKLVDNTAFEITLCSDESGIYGINQYDEIVSTVDIDIVRLAESIVDISRAVIAQEI
jgi:hypothetical protein